MNANWFNELLLYCMFHRRDRVNATLIAAGKCRNVSHTEYAEMLESARKWWVK